MLASITSNFILPSNYHVWSLAECFLIVHLNVFVGLFEDLGVFYLVAEP